MTKTLADAGLREYPFSVVAPIGPTQVWADRNELRKELVELTNSWAASPRSNIYLMWADLGAGKTHALRYVEALSALTNPASLAIYCDVADGTTDFKTLFQQVVARLPEEILAEAIYQHRRRAGNDWLSVPWLLGDRDTPRALWALAEMGSEPLGETARRWLRAERLTAREISFLSVTSMIRTSELAVRTMGTLCGLLSLGSQRHVALLLDEFQRVGQASQRRLREVNASISSLFNRCPNRLAIVLSYSLGTPEQVKYLVMPEVMSRVSGRFQLRRLNPREGREFVSEILQRHSIDGGLGTFTDEALASVVERLSADCAGEITPRRLMQAFAGILDRGLIQGRSFPVDARVAERLYQPPGGQ